MIYISKLWKFFNGYVIISIKGYNIEKLINKALCSGIVIRHIKKDKNIAEAELLPEDFKAFAELCARYRCRMRIVHKNGFYRTLLFMKRNALYTLGIFLSIAVIYALSQMVWIIDIMGNSAIDKHSILETCRNSGLYELCNKNSPDYKKIAEELRIKYKNIAWINISLKGSRVSIRLAEDKPAVKAVTDSEACDIVSTAQCRISYVVTEKGTPLVKKNDIVKEGDVLISAQLVPAGTEENPVTDIVRAKGSVRGILKRNYSFTIPYSINKREYTGRRRTAVFIGTAYRKICIKNARPFSPGEKSEEIIQLRLGEDCPLPFFIYKNIYSEYIEKRVNKDIETAKKEASVHITEFIAQNYDISSDILSVKTRYSEGKECLSVNAEIISDENIGTEKPHTDTGGSTINGTTENSGSG